MDAATPKQWVYLAPNPKSYLRQLFVKGTDFTAHDLFVLSVDDEEPMTKEQISKAYGVPEGAVEEAIAYAQSAGDSAGYCGFGRMVRGAWI
jgi:hypothetical protein